MEGGRGGGGAGWPGDREGELRVWREDREMDRITGFKSRTERDGERQREAREGERERAFRVQKTRKTCQIEKINTLNSTL